MTVRFVGDDRVIDVKPVGVSGETIDVIPQKDYEPDIKLSPGQYGPTVRTALGHVVHARSGVSPPSTSHSPPPSIPSSTRAPTTFLPFPSPTILLVT